MQPCFKLFYKHCKENRLCVHFYITFFIFQFEQEKYGNNYNEDAELVRAANKSKNPNDDLADIFLDNITKNKNPTRNSEIEKQQAINQNVKLERSLEGCEYCFDSKNMLKHLIVSCGNKIYMALPSRTSLVKGHCILSTIQHSTCVTNVDEDVWDEILVSNLFLLTTTSFIFVGMFTIKC